MTIYNLYGDAAVGKTYFSKFLIGLPILDGVSTEREVLEFIKAFEQGTYPNNSKRQCPQTMIVISNKKLIFALVDAKIKYLHMENK